MMLLFKASLEMVRPRCESNHNNLRPSKRMKLASDLPHVFTLDSFGNVAK
jgi:hypothetical protein